MHFRFDSELSEGIVNMSPGETRMLLFNQHQLRV